MVRDMWERMRLPKILRFGFHHRDGEINKIIYHCNGKVYKEYYQYNGCIQMADELATLRAIHEQNPWWTSGIVPEELVKPIKELDKPFKRRDFFVLRRKIDEKEINAIIGPRQVGKTTTLYQLIDFLIHEKMVDPKRIMFFSFDYPRLKAGTSINDVLEVYAANVLHELLRELRAPIYIFLDEVCKVQGWSRVLKGWYDLKYPIKFTVSHSSSSEIRKGASESLVGRIEPFTMLPLKFVDIVRFHDRETGEYVNHLSLKMREEFSQAIRDGNVKALFDSFKEAQLELTPREDILKALLREYLLKDGYPGLLGVSSLKACSQKLRDYLSLTLYKDVVQLFGIRDPAALEELVILLADSSSDLVEYSSLSRTLSMKLDTIKKYLDYLEAVFLISRAEFYSKSRAARIRKRDKIYVANVGLRNALLGQLDESLLGDATALGKVVETVVHEHCRRLCFYLSGPPSRLFYWRTPQGHEVDIVMEVARRTVPIEVTSGNEIPPKKLRGIKEFEKEHGAPFSVIVTRDVFDLKGKRIYIPLWLFLLMC
jgi:hypothetical protein